IRARNVTGVQTCALPISDLRRVPSAVDRWRAHTTYTDPGPHAHLLRTLDPATETVSAVARNLIAHYRGEAAALPESTREDVNLRDRKSVVQGKRLESGGR